MPEPIKSGFLYRKLVRPILDLLQQGVTPEKIALSVALGAAIGVFPALGWTTILCAIVALVWKLNLPAIQIINYFMYPQAETAEGRVDPFDPDKFKYEITAKELPAAA